MSYPPLYPPPYLPPSLYPPLEVGSLAIPGYRQYSNIQLNSQKKDNPKLNWEALCYSRIYIQGQYETEAGKG